MSGRGLPSTDGAIKFIGRNRADAKRKALNYWFINQKTLRLSLRDFSGRLLLLPDGKTIVYHKGR